MFPAQNCRNVNWIDLFVATRAICTEIGVSGCQSMTLGTIPAYSSRRKKPTRFNLKNGEFFTKITRNEKNAPNLVGFGWKEDRLDIEIGRGM